MCLSVNPQPQLWPSRTGLTETRGSDSALEGAGLFMAGPRACTDSQYGQYGQSVRTTFKP